MPGSKTSKSLSKTKTSKPKSNSKTSKPKSNSKTSKRKSNSKTSKQKSTFKTSKPKPKSRRTAKTKKQSKPRKMHGSKTSKPTKIIWKQIPGFPKYEASIYGEIRNFTTKIELKKQPSGGYYTVGLMNEYDQIPCRVNRLIALTFIPNPNNLPVVDHINNDKLNDDVTNLRWVTYAQNVQAYNENYKKNRKVLQYEFKGDLIKTWDSIHAVIKENPTFVSNYIYSRVSEDKTAYGFTWIFDPPIVKIDVDPNEKFKTIPDINGYDLSSFEISKKGNVKTKKGTKVLAMRPDKFGYVVVDLWCCNKSVKFKIHRLLAYTYLKNDDPINKTTVDHIDKNRQNYDLSNLEWVSSHENCVRAKGVMIKMLDKDTNEVLKIFRCATDALRYLGIKLKGNSSITRALRGRRPSAHGYKWEYVKKGEKLTLPIEKVEITTKIFEITIADIEAVDYTDVY